MYFYLLTTAFLGYESLAGEVWCASLSSKCVSFAQTLTVTSLSGATFLTDAALLPFGIKLKKQLSVMGMSVRIGLWSPISLTLTPRVGITLIAASRDSLNPQLSLWGFSSLTTIRQTVSQNTLLPHQLAHEKWTVSDSSEIHFNYLFMCISVTELDGLQVSDTLQCLESAFCLPDGNLRALVLLYYLDFAFFCDLIVN